MIAVAVILAVIVVAFLMARMLVARVCRRLMFGVGGRTRLVSSMVPGMVRCGIHPPNIYPWGVYVQVW